MAVEQNQPAWWLRAALAQAAFLGAPVLNFFVLSGQLTLLGIRAARAMYQAPQRRAVLIAQMYRIGYLSLPIVLLTGLSMSLVLAIQGYSTLRQFNGENITGGMVSYSVITQIMPVLAGLTLAGRVGSAIAAEIGTMKVTEQIDALRVMGTDPIAYLVVPRLLACVLLLPLLTAIGAAFGLLGAAWMVIWLWEVDAGAYWFHAQEFVSWWEIVTGCSKTFLYGGIIALVACRKGLLTKGGATGVGEACTSAVVDASMLILVTTFVATVLIQRMTTLIWG